MSRKGFLAFLAASAICFVIFSVSYATSQTTDQSGIVISGIVRDSNSNGISGVKVTLYNGNMINGQFTNSNIADVANNPQMTSDGSPVKGMFVFTRLPKGVYNITVEKNGFLSSQVIRTDEGSGTLTPLITLSGYGEKPTTAVKPSSTTQGTPGQTGADQTSILPSFYDIIKLLSMAAIGAQLVFCLVVLALFANTKK
ncbi:MAG TPA: carboxypeptidase-like regulatory domain-containing protein [Methanocellaceae archaeon]|jgi:hypothetical protein